MAERGFFVKEMNAGWAEWTAAGLPTHGNAQLAQGTLRCACSLHPELVRGEAGGETSPTPPGP